MNALEIITEYAEQEVNEDMTIESLGLDSLEFLDLLVQLNIPDEKSVNLHTVGDLLREAQ